MLLTVVSINSKGKMFILHETSTNLGKLSMDVNSIPGINQISHYSELLHTYNLLAVKIADKLIKAHCLPLDSVLKHSAP